MDFPVRTMTRSSLLDGQSNGRLGGDILETTPGQAGGATVVLVKPAARAWRALCAAAKRAGHTLKATSVADSYRIYEIQERIFRERYTTTFLAGRPYKIWNGRRWYQRPGTAIAAVPGTSNHGWASAVDTGEERDSDAGAESLDDPTLAWLISNEQIYGWSHELQSEPWHLRYFAGDAIPPAVLAYEAGTTTPDDEEDDVPRIVKADSKPQVWVTDGIHKRLLEDQAEADELVYVGLAKRKEDGKPYRMTLDVLSDIPTVSK